MLGLAGYESSDDEAEAVPAPQVQKAEAIGQDPTNKDVTQLGQSTTEVVTHVEPAAVPQDSTNAPPALARDDTRPTTVAGPQMPVEVVDEQMEDAPADDGPPLSPYSSQRLALRNLTMPPVPNFDIPPSPPGSPPPDITKRFDNFLALKTKGVHFNAKLASSSQLRNPSLLRKLTAFAGIDDRDQYASALPEDLAVPVTYPPWAYAEQLNKKQAEMQKRKEEGKKGRDGIEFVAASAGSPGGPGAKKSHQSAAERVMAGSTDRVRGDGRAVGGRRQRSRSRSPRKQV